MRLSPLLLLGLVPRAMANFDIYQEGGYGVRTEWKIFNDMPNCDNIYETHSFEAMGDVSGDKRGFRCEGKGCLPTNFGSPDEIEVLEMNFGTHNGNLYHFTTYKDRNWDLVGLDGRVWGECFPYPFGDYDCLARKGKRKLRCITEVEATTLGDFRES